MRWWGKRKRAANSKTLSIEPLEDRHLMAAIPLASGQAVSFHDADGTHVKVKLIGPGTGTIELDGGVLDGADIDSIVLNDTTGASKLKISTRGGAVKGTTVNDLVINKALNEVGALKKLTGRKVDFASGGELTADGGIEHLRVRTLGGEVNVDGDVKKLKVEAVDPDAAIDVTGSIARFVAKLLDQGSTLGANQIEMLKIKDQADGASVETGTGGLAKAKIKNIYNSSIASQGLIGDVVVKGDTMGTAFASNINMGSDLRYGTIDDFVVDRSATGYIQSVKLKGALGGGGTSQEVRIVSSGTVGNVEVSTSATAQGHQPMIWEQAASKFTPLSIVQASLEATGFADDEIYVAIFGVGLPPNAITGVSYYLAPSGTPGTLPTLTQVPNPPMPSSTTPNLVTLPSYKLSDWADTTQFWGSGMNFPPPPPNNKWSGRIVISAGAPVQAQIAMDGSVNAPSPSDPTDPSTGTFYDFVEFTVTADGNGNPTLDADTSQVDSFGMPMSLQFFDTNATFFSGTTDGTMQDPTNSITGIADTTGLVIGQTVYGPGIANGTTISTITPSQGMTPGSITVNTTITTSTMAGNFAALTPPWSAYDYTFNGVAMTGSKTITGVTNIQALVLQQYFGFGQPVIAAGILAPGTVVTDYDIDANTITLNKVAIGTTTGPSTTFTYEVAGPVGVQAERDELMSLTNPNGLTQFLQQLVAGGNDFARPFLQSTAPFLTNGPVPISGATNNGGPIELTTSGTGVLQPGDQIEVDGVEGNTAANGVFQVASKTATTITLGSPIGNGTYASGTGTWSIAGSPVLNTSTSQAVISANAADITAANLQNGDTVTIASVGGNTAVNGTFMVTQVESDSFELLGPVSGGVGTAGTWTMPGTSLQGSITSTSASGTQITLTTSAAGLVAGDVVIVSGVTGNPAANGTWVVMDPVVSTSFTGFTLGSPAGSNAYTSGGTWTFGGTGYDVNGATRGGQVVVTTNGTTGLSSGDTVTVSNVVGNNAANGTFPVSEVTSTTFALDGSLSNGVFISGGTWTQTGGTPTNVTGASDGPLVISTASTGNLQNGDLVTISGVQGNTAANGTFVVSNVVANTSFQLANPIGNANYQEYGTWSMSVTDASNSVITTASTAGLENGDFVDILGVAGNQAVNGRWLAGNVTPTSFALMAPVGNANYTSGGTWNLPGSGTNINITNVTNFDVPIVVTAQSVAGLEVGTIINIQNVGGNSAANGLFVVSAINGLDISLGAPVSMTPYSTSSGTWTATFTPSATGTVTYASKGDDITIVTANTAGLVTGAMVEVMGVQGNSSANNIFYVGEVTPTTFTLEGSQFSGSYTLGGIWKQYAALNRLISPKDLTESLLSPDDPSAINNYYNDMIDNFFLQYYTGTIDTWNGGGQTIEIVSTAYNGSPITYSGTFQQVTIDNPAMVQQYTGYALQLKEAGMSPTDPNTYNVIYPFFNTNAPSPEIYTPLFGTFDPPTWIVTNQQQFESATQMIFACNAVFADNVYREGIDIPLPTVSNANKVLGDLENSIAAAFNRGIIMNDPSTWSDVTTWFPADTTYNYWVQYWHQPNLTFGDLAYAFPYDDKYGLSTNLQVANAGLAQITLGNWSSTRHVAEMTLSSSTMQPATQQGPASFTATLTGSHGTPTGSVAFFLDGIALNSDNNSSSPPLQLNPLAGGAYTINVNLPPTSDAGNEHEYTVTAVYNGDSNYLPTLAKMTLKIAATT